MNESPQAVWTTPPGMNCPNCHIALIMTERQGVEIDYCSQCRGVWLDRGELDKIIMMSMQQNVAPNAPRAAQPMPTPPTQAPPVVYQQSPIYTDPHHNPHYDPHHDPHRNRHHNRGFLGGLFDFD